MWSRSTYQEQLYCVTHIERAHSQDLLAWGMGKILVRIRWQPVYHLAALIRSERALYAATRLRT